MTCRHLVVCDCTKSRGEDAPSRVLVLKPRLGPKPWTSVRAAIRGRVFNCTKKIKKLRRRGKMVLARYFAIEFGRQAPLFLSRRRKILGQAPRCGERIRGSAAVCGGGAAGSEACRAGLSMFYISLNCTVSRARMRFYLPALCKAHLPSISLVERLTSIW